MPSRTLLRMSLPRRFSLSGRRRGLSATAAIKRTRMNRNLALRRLHRGQVLRAQRGFVRTGGFFGRFGPGSGELKFFDTTKAATSVTTASVVDASLNLIGQGVTESQRVGRKCTIKGIFIKGQLLKAATTTQANGSERVRIIVYLDKQANGATAATINVLVASLVNSFRNMANSQRFVVLSDKTHTLNATAASGNGTTDESFESARHVRINIGNVAIPIEFSSTTGAIGEIRSNNIGILYLADSGGLVTFGYTARVRFSDNG